MVAILRDFLLPGTPFRGLIVRGPYSLCAYIGVPQDHWVADMADLEFDCHRGVTFSGLGGDGIRPEGWYWYGWDYAHFGDALDLPPEIVEALRISGLASSFARGKKWTLEEVEHDLIDVVVKLQAALNQAEAASQNLESRAKLDGGSHRSRP